jgi:hypothetical protein
MATQIDGWVVQVVPPRDMLDNLTPISAHLQRRIATGEGPYNRDGWGVKTLEAALGEFKSALTAAHKHPYWHKDGLRQEPLVGYDPVTDGNWYLFKLDENGTTIIVSPHGFPLLAKVEE